MLSWSMKIQSMLNIALFAILTKDIISRDIPIFLSDGLVHIEKMYNIKTTHNTVDRYELSIHKAF